VLWTQPNCFWPTSGAAEGITPLNAFDNALLRAGIGNLNLIKLSSVLPAAAVRLTQPPAIAHGSLVPTVYTTRTGTTPGEVVAAAVGIGFQREGHGMIYECTGNSRAAVESQVRRMVEDSFVQRGYELHDFLVASAEHRVESVGCALAAVVLWWG
jgi:arginine decarboxylase